MQQADFGEFSLKESKKTISGHLITIFSDCLPSIMLLD